MTRKVTLVLLITFLALTACQGTLKEPLDDDFNEPGSWKLNSDAAAEFTIQDGLLRAHINEPGQIAWAAAGKDLSDFRLKVDATLENGPINNEYGVLIRMEGDTRFYAFSMSSDGYARIARYSEGSWEVIGSDWTPVEAIKQNQATNTLEIEAQGKSFSFKINGTPIATVQEDEEGTSHGDIGLYAGAFDEGDLTITFDNLRIEPLP